MYVCVCLSVCVCACVIICCVLHVCACWVPSEGMELPIHMILQVEFMVHVVLEVRYECEPQFQIGFARVARV